MCECFRFYCRHSQIHIGPTGYKANIWQPAFFLGPALVDPRTTVLVAPYVAVRAQYVRQAGERGITADIRKPSLNALPRLLIVPVESLGDGDLLGFLFSHKQRIVRIVFDEAHILGTETHYRPRLQQAHHLRRSLAKPVTVLSATMPPRLLAVVCQQLLMSEPMVLRQSSIRANAAVRTTLVLVHRLTEADRY